MQLNNILKKLIPLALFILRNSILFCQNGDHNTWIVPTSEEQITACVNNTIKVYARQKKPIALNDIKAKLIRGYQVVDEGNFVPIGKELKLIEIGKNEFSITGVDTVGVIDFEIRLEKGLDKVTMKVVPLSVRFTIGGRNLEKIDVLDLETLKEARGIATEIFFNGLYAFGEIQRFTFVGIKQEKLLPEILNESSVFNNKVKDVINSLQKGDLIFIRNIHYKVGCIEQVFDYDFIIKLD